MNLCGQIFRKMTTHSAITLIQVLAAMFSSRTTGTASAHDHRSSSNLNSISAATTAKSKQNHQIHHIILYSTDWSRVHGSQIYACFVRTPPYIPPGRYESVKTCAISFLTPMGELTEQFLQVFARSAVPVQV